MFAEIDLRRPDRPCLSSCLGGVIDPQLPQLLWRIVREPMNVPAAVACAEVGFAGETGAVYIDLSPSGALAAETEVPRKTRAPETGSAAAPIKRRALLRPAMSS